MKNLEITNYLFNKYFVLMGNDDINKYLEIHFEKLSDIFDVKTYIDLEEKFYNEYISVLFSEYLNDINDDIIDNFDCDRVRSSKHGEGAAFKINKSLFKDVEHLINIYKDFINNLSKQLN